MGMYVYGHTAAFELLAEETTEEGAEPVFQLIVGVFPFEATEDFPCHYEDAPWARMVGDEMPKEKVVQFVGTNDVLRLLSDDIWRPGGDELWRDGGVNDVEQGIVDGRIVRCAGDVTDDVLHQRLWDAAVDAVHG